MEVENLSKKERRQLAKDLKKLEQESESNSNSLRNISLKLAIGLLLGISLVWIYRSLTKPLPGQSPEDLGREHVTDIAGVNYSSNPPTSGDHFAIWAKDGVYDRVVSDGYLIHSLEHGYVIVSYDCTKPIAFSRSLFTVLAHDEPAKESTDSGELLKHMNFKPKTGESWFGPENAPDEELKLPDEFNSDKCKELVTQLEGSLKLAERVIVVPRPGMDTMIALTAWGRIEKLTDYDKAKIKDFVKSFHNRGPEKTME